MGFAIYGMAVILAPAAGPALGDWVTDHYAWRWIFFINLPAGIASLAFLFVPIDTLAYTDITEDRNDDVSSMVNLARNVGGSVGIALIWIAHDLSARRPDRRRANRLRRTGCPSKRTATRSRNASRRLRNMSHRPATEEAPRTLAIPPLTAAIPADDLATDLAHELRALWKMSRCGISCAPNGAARPTSSGS